MNSWEPYEPEEDEGDPLGEAWSDELARRLLAGVPGAELEAHWGATAGALREIIELSLEDAATRNWIAGAFRRSDPELVAALDEIWSEDLRPFASRLHERFGAERLMLGAITNPEEGGIEGALDFIEALPDPLARKECDRVLARFESDGELLPGAPRVAVVGGLSRERTRMSGIFRRRGFNFVWHSVSKNRGRMRSQRWFGGLGEVCAMIVITGRSGHDVLNAARRLAKKQNVPFRCIERATERQLEEVLEELRAERGRALPPGPGG